MEEEVSIAGAEASLEGRLLAGDGGGGVVITHPHPLFGGSMDNNVVWTAGSAFAARRWTTLRFNFRGAGRSTGNYGGGLAEVADLAAALDFLKTRTPGPHYVVGYSFGAFVAARALLQGFMAQGTILIAPPIAFMDLSFLPRAPGLRLVVMGDRDQLCPLADWRRLWAGEAAPLGVDLPDTIVIAGADHFFWGREEQLFQVLRDFPL
jgi:alpha/beta superfamily hydrolase